MSAEVGAEETKGSGHRAAAGRGAIVLAADLGERLLDRQAEPQTRRPR